jgi:hypothetical protein
MLIKRSLHHIIFGSKSFSVARVFVALATSALMASVTFAQSSPSQQIAGAGAKGATSLSLVFPQAVASGDTVVVIVSYANSANVGAITVSGLGASWMQGFHPAVTSGSAVAFFYGTNIGSNATTLTVSAPHPDNLSVAAQEWSNLTPIEDPGSQTQSSGTGVNANGSTLTANPNDVVFTAVSYSGGTLSSPPQGDFHAILTPQSSNPPYLLAADYVVGMPGTYANTFIFQNSTKWQSVSVALESVGAPNPYFSATPLTDFAPNELYLGKFSGMLYDGSNSPSPAHDADGRTFAAEVQPLDVNGNPSPTGKIGVVALGMSNWTEEWCTGAATGLNRCDPYTFMDQAHKLPNINPNMVLVDCAQGNADTQTWLTATTIQWKNCMTNLGSVFGLTPAQVQVVMWKNADDAPATGVPMIGLSQLNGTSCPAVPNPRTAPDACVYEQRIATVARLVKVQFPNVKQMFLHSRIYSGYANAQSPHREPFSYEYGFATKWLIAAQTTQLATGTIDPLAGDLSYNSAPWLAWGPYFWAAGSTPRADGTTWLGGDLTWDGIHASWCRFYGASCGRQKVANLMMGFYTTSPYSPWFVTGP